MFKDCYIFGLQRSGTNFLKSLVEDQGYRMLNWRKKNTKFWKHTHGINTNYEGLVLYVVKHPNKWIESINKKALDIRKFRNFKCSRKNVSGCKKLWTAHTKYWEEKASLIIRYEDLLRDPQQFFTDIVTVPEEVAMSHRWDGERSKKLALQGLTKHERYDSWKYDGKVKL
jgi:hypothetical protein